MAKMEHPLSDCVESYSALVAQGDIARAYRAILSTLTRFKTAWEAAHPADNVGALYQGYLDMSFVSVAPAAFTDKRLKISLVFLHDSGIFSLWLIAGNRAIQKTVSDSLRTIPLGGYARNPLAPGVDAIIAHDLPKPYAFDDPAALNEMLMQAAEAFTADMIQLIESLSNRSRHAD